GCAIAASSDFTPSRITDGHLRVSQSSHSSRCNITASKEVHVLCGFVRRISANISAIALPDSPFFSQRPKDFPYRPRLWPWVDYQRNVEGVSTRCRNGPVIRYGFSGPKSGPQI